MPLLSSKCLYNLVKNAAEAGASKVHIQGKHLNGHSIIELTDNGSGIANPGQTCLCRCIPPNLKGRALA